MGRTLRIDPLSLVLFVVSVFLMVVMEMYLFDMV